MIAFPYTEQKYLDLILSKKHRFLSGGGDTRSPPTQRKQSASPIPVGQQIIGDDSSSQLRGGGTKDRELEQLRREISTLRYEKSEDQKTINELHKRLDSALEDHQKVLSNTNEQHR